MKRIAYLGIKGSYSHLAAQQYFKDTPDIELVGMKTFRDIFKQVESCAVDFGLVPVENSLAGSVYDNYDLLYEHSVSVVGEHYLKIDLHLLGTESEMPSEIRLQHMNKVVSHYKALEQSEGFFLRNPSMQKEMYGDTATAAKFVADQKDPLLGAIASKETAAMYGLNIIEENVHDNPFNYTRFLVIAKDPQTISGTDKCSVIFTVLHLPGSLVMALEVLSKNDMNLIKIESRPIHGKPFEYLFYADIMWDIAHEQSVPDVLEKLKQKTQSLKVLGYYKSGTLTV